MNNTFDYNRAKAYLRSGSRDDLIAGQGLRAIRAKLPFCLVVVVPVLVLSLTLTIVFGRMLASEPRQVDGLLPSGAETILADHAGESSQQQSEASENIPSVEPHSIESATPAQTQQEEPAEPDIHARDIVVQSGDTLLDLLVREGVDRDQAHGVIGALKPVFNPRRLRRDQALTLTYENPGEESLEFKSLNIKLDPEREILVNRCEDNSFTANEIVNEFEIRTQRSEFEINSSLYVAAEQHGVPFDMLLPLINTYAYDVDFQRDIRVGDYFEIMYDTKVDADGEVVCSGITSFAALTTQGRRLTLYRYQDSEGAVDYFDEKGRSLKKNLMITPVDGARISSRYGKRRHPILGYSRMHKGLDFAAPSGTPIKAAGDGVVVSAAYGRAYGNNVMLRHPGDYKTRYAHMRRFAKGIRSGVRVKQGQIIGYVGSTGLSTGPHLHYEIYQNGSSINPARIKTKPSRILQGTELERFMQAKTELEVQFASLKEPTVFAQIHKPEA